MDRDDGFDREEWLKSKAYAKLITEDALAVARTLWLIKEGKWLAAELAKMPSVDGLSRDEAIRRAFFEGARAAYYGMIVADDVPAEKENIHDALYIEFMAGVGKPLRDISDEEASS